MNRFDRALGIVLALRGDKEVSAQQLAKRFGVSSRTIYRDMQSLSTLGVPIYSERGRAGGFRLLAGYFLPPIMFTEDEALGLILGLTLLQAMRSRPFSQALDTAEKKLVAAVPDSLRELLLEARQRIGFEMPESDIFHPEPAPAEPPISGLSPAHAAPDDVVQVFLQGVFHRTAVTLHYRSPYHSEATQRVIEPFGVLWDREYWYLVGRRADGHRDVRLWRADRVTEIRPTDQTLDIQTGFDIREYLGRKWLGAALQSWMEQAPVKIRLTQRLADRLRQDWYYRQAAFEPLSESETLLSIGSDDVEAVLELLRWLGVGAELVEPVQWRGLMKAQLAQMLSSYAEDDISTGTSSTHLYQGEPKVK
jgi:predicted DNA-binding transcriptional regulator YafY